VYFTIEACVTLTLSLLINMMVVAVAAQAFIGGGGGGAGGSPEREVGLSTAADFLTLHYPRYGCAAVPPDAMPVQAGRALLHRAHHTPRPWTSCAAAQTPTPSRQHCIDLAKAQAPHGLWLAIPGTSGTSGRWGCWRRGSRPP
jgi:hypothetical protein